MRISTRRVTAVAFGLLAFTGCTSTSSQTAQNSDPWWKFGMGSKNSANNVAANAPMAPANPTLPSAVTSPGTPMGANAGPGTSGTFAGSPYLPPASSPGNAYPGTTGAPGSIYGPGGQVNNNANGYGQNAFAASPAHTATPTAYPAANNYSQPSYPATGNNYANTPNSYGAGATSYPSATSYPGTNSYPGATGYPGTNNMAAAHPAAMPGAAATQPQVGYYGSNYGQPAAGAGTGGYAAQPTNYNSPASNGYPAAQPSGYPNSGYGAGTSANAGYNTAASNGYSAGSSYPGTSANGYAAPQDRLASRATPGAATSAYGAPAGSNANNWQANASGTYPSSNMGAPTATPNASAPAAGGYGGYGAGASGGAPGSYGSPGSFTTPASTSTVNPSDRPDSNYRPGGTSNYAPAGSNATRMASSVPTTAPATGLPSGNVQTSYDTPMSGAIPTSAPTPAYGVQTNTSVSAGAPFGSGMQR